MRLVLLLFSFILDPAEFITRTTKYQVANHGDFLPRQSYDSHLAVYRDMISYSSPNPLSSIMDSDESVANRFAIWYKDSGDTPLAKMANPEYFNTTTNSFELRMIPLLTGVPTDDLYDFIQSKQADILKQAAILPDDNVCSSLSRGSPVFSVQSRDQVCYVI
jgi:hypothetical protein